MKRLPPAQETELTLTESERDIIRAYRTTDERGKIFIASVAHCQAERWPRRVRPKLQLVGSTTKSTTTERN